MLCRNMIRSSVEDRRILRTRAAGDLGDIGRADLRTEDPDLGPPEMSVPEGRTDAGVFRTNLIWPSVGIADHVADVGIEPWRAVFWMHIDTLSHSPRVVR
jgi:hypothetical protein